MKTKSPTLEAALEALYQCAGRLSELAGEACDRRDTHAVHWLVSEERRAANLARTLERRLG